MTTEKIFWLAALPSCWMAFAFAFKYRGLDGAKGAPADRWLARGQEHDDWLTCLAIWSALLTGNWDGRDLLLVACAIALIWTGWRSYRRLKLLGRRPR